MPKKRYYKKPSSQLKIAKNRVDFLFRQAKVSFKKSPKTSDRYVKMAKRVAMKYKLKLPASQKKSMCKHCHKYLVPGSNCRVRLHKHRLIYYCQSCKHYMRHPVK